MTPEEEARAAFEADPAPLYPDGRPKMHRHGGQHAIHRDDECNDGLYISEDGAVRWTTSRRRVYVFDDDYLTEHERFISERVFDEGFATGVDWSRGATLNDEADNPYREEE